MSRLLAPGLAAAALALLAACQPPPAPSRTTGPVTAPGLGSDLDPDLDPGLDAGTFSGAATGGAPVEQVQVDPLPALGE